jgi:hypothetical protein
MKAPGSEGFGVAQERAFADLARAGEHDHGMVLAGLGDRWSASERDIFQEVNSFHS